jgi:hypothetical protein
MMWSRQETFDRGASGFSGLSGLSGWTGVVQRDKQDKPPNQINQTNSLVAFFTPPRFIQQVHALHIFLLIWFVQCAERMGVTLDGVMDKCSTLQ